MAEMVMQKSLVLDPMNAIVSPDGNSWAALGNDTTGLDVDLDHVYGTKSLEFDKVNGAANTKIGGIDRTLASSFSVDKFAAGSIGFLMWSVNVQAKTNVDYAFLRLGTSASHYNEWRVPKAQLSTYWNLCRVAISDPDSSGSKGNGWDSSAITYVAIGLAFDAETDALADIRVDRIVITSALLASADISTEKSTVVTTGDVNVDELGGETVKVEDQAYAAEDPGVPGLIVRKDSRAAVGSGANGDYTQMQGTATGELRVRDDDVNTDLDAIAADLANGVLTRTVVNLTIGAGATGVLIAAGSACRYIVACVLMTDTETDLTINSDTVATQLTGNMPVSARSGFVLPPWKGTTGGWLKGDSTKNLTITSSAAADIDGFIITRDLA